MKAVILSQTLGGAFQDVCVPFIKTINLVVYSTFKIKSRSEVLLRLFHVKGLLIY